MKIGLIVLFSYLLVACTTVYKPYCPSLVNYTKEFNLKLADELKTAGPITKRTISDYIALRDAIRECDK